MQKKDFSLITQTFPCARLNTPIFHQPGANTLLAHTPRANPPTLAVSAVAILVLVALTAFFIPITHAQEMSLERLALPLYAVQDQLIYKKLTNGIVLRLLPLETSESVSLASQFRVGSRNEQSGQTGYAHLFEHMLFKGSKHAPGDSYSQIISSLSGQFNASTHFDFTHYYLTLPPEVLALVLWLEADRFIAPELTQDSVANQQTIVIEEMATRIDNQPYLRQIMAFLLSHAKGTPYKHAIIGTKADITNASVASLRAFHQTFYQPNAMQLSIVGNLPSSTSSWVDMYFGQWQNNPISADHFHVDRSQLTLLNKPVHGEIIDSRARWPVLLLAWHTVGKHHSDAAAINVQEAYLFQDKASLVKRVRDDPPQMLNYSIPLSMEYMGVANLVLVPRAKTSLNQLAVHIDAMLDRVSTNGITEQSLYRLKARWLNDALQKLDNPQALAIHLSATLPQDNQTPLTGPWQRIDAVSSEDIQRVANQYFNQGYLRLDLQPAWYIRWTKSVLEMLPDGLADNIEQWAL